MESNTSGGEAKAADHALAERVVLKYLSSMEFNGLGVRGITDLDTVVDLIRLRHVDLVRGDGHPNPHIKAFPEEPVEVQLKKLATDGLGQGCLYPSRRLLEASKAGARFGDRPFTRELALGSAQLEFRVFDLRLLEFFRNDPRFHYSVDDVMGSIWKKAEHREEPNETVADGLELARFGFAYDAEGHRAVALFLRDLSRLDAEQQQMINSYKVKGEYELHPDFAGSAMYGNWPERVSIYDAFLEEKKHINAMCELMGHAHLFKTDETNPRPHGFGILLRPTNKEFRDFVLLLNTLLTDDLNIDFFKPDIATSEVVTKDDGSRVNQRIGTIKLLQTWLSPPRFRAGDDKDLALMFKKLRNIRDQRARPAHNLEDNAFDQKYVVEQRALIIDGFFVVRTLRMILENHPKARGYAIPKYLREALVWTM